MPVYVIDTLKPKNGLDFPVVEAVDVAVEGYSSLADAVTHFATDTAIAAINAALDTKADKTTTDSLQAQIDQIVISASAESVVAPEVAAARVGADGTSYNTLKARLDGEIVPVQESLNAFAFVLTKANVEQGAWENGQKAATTLRLRSKEKAIIPVGSIIEIDPNGLYFDIKQFQTVESTTASESSGWIGGSTTHLRIVINYPYVCINIANGKSYAESTAIVPDNFVSNLFAFKVNSTEVITARIGADSHEYSTLKERLDSEYDLLNERLDSEYDLLNERISGASFTLLKEDVESGAWINGEKVEDSKRIRSKTKTPLPIGSIIEIDTHGLYAYVIQVDDPDNEQHRINQIWFSGKKKIVVLYPYVYFSFANSATWETSTSISVNDYGCEINVLKTTLFSDLEEKTEKLPLMVDTISPSLITNEVNGYIGTNYSILSPTADAEKTCDYVPIKSGDVIKVSVIIPAKKGVYTAIALYDTNKNGLSRTTNYNVTKEFDGWRLQETSVTASTNGYVRASYRTFGYDNCIRWLTINGTPYSLTDIVYNDYQRLHTLESTTENNGVSYLGNLGNGYINTSGGITQPSAEYQEKYTQLIPVTAGENFVLTTLIRHNAPWVSYAYFDENGELIDREASYSGTWISDTVMISTFRRTIPDGCTGLRASWRTYGDCTELFTKEGTYANENHESALIIYESLISEYEKSKINTVRYTDSQSSIKSVNHRGYNTIAPENTLPAFRLSKEKGFSIVETDIDFTSDGVAVCIHDSTINRTARNLDGSEIEETVSVRETTYQDLIDNYDFGIYKGEEYAGTKIPRYEEFLSLCKKLGLKCYIELKSGTEQQIKALRDTAFRYGMIDSITWISATYSLLLYMHTYAPKDRIGWVVSEFTSGYLSGLSALTEENNCFLDIQYTGITEEAVNLAIQNNVQIEAWTVNQNSQMESLDEYVTGVTSDSIIAGYYFYMHN